MWPSGHSAMQRAANLVPAPYRNWAETAGWRLHHSAMILAALINWDTFATGA